MNECRCKVGLAYNTLCSLCQWSLIFTCMGFDIHLISAWLVTMFHKLHSSKQSSDKKAQMEWILAKKNCLINLPIHVGHEQMSCYQRYVELIPCHDSFCLLSYEPSKINLIKQTTRKTINDLIISVPVLLVIANDGQATPNVQVALFYHKLQ